MPVQKTTRQIANDKTFLQHGHARAGQVTPIFQIWSQMIMRCTNPRNKQWKDYGGRGIRVCNRWKLFSNFLSDMGQRPDGMTLGRKDNDGHYEKRNCEWQTRVQQARNTSKNKIVTVSGVTACVAEHCERFHVVPSTAYGRLSRGWSPERTFLIHHAAGHR